MGFKLRIVELNENFLIFFPSEPYYTRKSHNVFNACLPQIDFIYTKANKPIGLFINFISFVMMIFISWQYPSFTTSSWCRKLLSNCISSYYCPTPSLRRKPQFLPFSFERNFHIFVHSFKALLKLSHWLQHPGLKWIKKKLFVTKSVTVY